jgi:hypothetical protein
MAPTSLQHSQILTEYMLRNSTWFAGLTLEKQRKNMGGERERAP